MSGATKYISELTSDIELINQRIALFETTLAWETDPALVGHLNTHIRELRQERDNLVAEKDAAEAWMLSDDLGVHNDA